MDLNENETKYFEIFRSKLTPAENKKLSLKRLSNGAIEPYSGTFPLGKVKLSGRKYWIQVFKSLLKVDIIEGSFEEILAKQDETIKYMRKYCK